MDLSQLEPAQRKRIEDAFAADPSLKPKIEAALARHAARREGAGERAEPSPIIHPRSKVGRAVLAEAAYVEAQLRYQEALREDRRIAARRIVDTARHG